MRAARNLSHGYVDEKGEGQTIAIAAGEEIPEAFIGDIPDDLVLETLAINAPNKLSRAQLMTLAGLDGESVEDLAPIEYNEDELREVLAELRYKGDLVEWFETIRPTSEQPDPAWTRTEIVDYIIEEMVGE